MSPSAGGGADSTDPDRSADRVRDAVAPYVDLTPDPVFLSVFNYCHTMRPAALYRIRETVANFKFVFLGAYHAMTTHDGATAFRTCVHCAPEYYPGVRGVLRYEERCYHRAEHAQRYNRAAVCSRCRVYFVRMNGASYFGHRFDAVNDTNELEIQPISGRVHLRQAVELAYHY